MSLFLGKIHYWLFDKISWFENIEDEIVDWADSEELPVGEWTKSIYHEFGYPTEKKPLEDIIDTSNIHGWLQGRIESAEFRQAALVTEILSKDPRYKEDLMSIFKNQGSNAAREYGETVGTPEGVYNAMNDFILEGMPCDRVNEAVSSDENEFVWKTVYCIHKPYWDRVSGDVQNFHDLREAWIKAFVTSLNPEFEYIRLSDNTYKIARKGD